MYSFDFEASQEGFLDSVLILLKHKADVNAKDSDDQTALFKGEFLLEFFLPFLCFIFCAECHINIESCRQWTLPSGSKSL